MMNLAESLKFTADQAERAVGAKGKIEVISLPQEPAGVYGIVKPDGSFERVTASPSFRQHRLQRVDQVIDFVADAKSRLAAKPTVWFNDTGVIVLLDDSPESNRESRVSVEFENSDQFEVLGNCAESWKDPKQFSFWIRSELIDALRNGKTVLDLLKSLSFHVQETGNVKLGQGRESLGREIDAEITSEFGDLPETLTFDVRVFADPSLIRRHSVECALEIDPKRCLLRVIPLANQLRNAEEDELNGIGDLLKKNLDCPVYYGRP